MPLSQHSAAGVLFQLGGKKKEKIKKKVLVFKVFKQMESHKLQSVEGACFMTNKICQVGCST